MTLFFNWERTFCLIDVQASIYYREAVAQSFNTIYEILGSLSLVQYVNLAPAESNAHEIVGNCPLKGAIQQLNIFESKSNLWSNIVSFLYGMVSLTVWFDDTTYSQKNVFVKLTFFDHTSFVKIDYGVLYLKNFLYDMIIFVGSETHKFYGT